MEQHTTTRPANIAVRRRSSSAESTISLRDIVDEVLSRWYWYVISALIFGSLTYLLMASKSNIYQRQAVMLVKDDNQNSSSRRSAISPDALMSLNGVFGGASVKNEIYILQSYQLCQEVVRMLGLDVAYDHKGGLRTTSLYKNSPITASFDGETENSTFYRVVLLNKNEYRLVSVVRKGKKLAIERTCRFDQQVKTPAGNFTLTLNDKFDKKLKDQEYIVSHYSIDDATVLVCNKVTTSEIDKESTLVQITCVDTSIERADDILSSLLEAYKRSIIDDKNTVAQSTAAFIDDRIHLISNELSDVEGELADFKERNNVVDFSQNAQAYLNQSSQARQRTIQFETQLSAIEYLSTYLRDNSRDNALIPAMGGITDVGIATQITNYNQLMLQRNRLAANASESSAAIREMDANLSQMHSAVMASLQGYLSSLRLQVSQARQDERLLESGLSSVPQKERRGLDIARQQAIKETLYTYLLNKREETTLQLAVSEANIRVVERPFGSSTPIGPHRNRTLAIALLFGLVVPFVFFRIKAMLNVAVRGRADIEAGTTIPILGEIPHRKDGIADAEIVVGEQKDDPISEAFRMMRFSMSFINKDARVIMFTSTTPSEGKTFVSRNFAETLALTKKRVLLVDTDIRKRTQSKLTANRSKDGLTSYLSGAIDNVSDLIVKHGADRNFDFMPAGITPPNPAELLMSNRLDKLFEELKQTYDYIVVDNVPAQVVADAGIVNRVADITMYVIREGGIDRRYLKEIEKLHQDKKFRHMSIVLNDSHIERKKYGYGSGYGYSYGYGYGRDKGSKKRGFFKRKNN